MLCSALCIFGMQNKCRSNEKLCVWANWAGESETCPRYGKRLCRQNATERELALLEECPKSRGLKLVVLQSHHYPHWVPMNGDAHCCSLYRIPYIYRTWIYTSHNHGTWWAVLQLVKGLILVDYWQHHRRRSRHLGLRGISSLVETVH